MEKLDDGSADRADWTGVKMRSVPVGARRKNRHLKLDGYLYCTPFEWQFAGLLKKHGIPFTPDVQFDLRRRNGKIRVFIPDFVFNGAVIAWQLEDGTIIRIHGVEVKGNKQAADPNSLGHKNVKLLKLRRGIFILLLSNDEVQALHARGRLPIRRKK